MAFLLVDDWSITINVVSANEVERGNIRRISKLHLLSPLYLANHFSLDFFIEIQDTTMKHWNTPITTRLQ